METNDCIMLGILVILLICYICMPTRRNHRYKEKYERVSNLPLSVDGTFANNYPVGKCNNSFELSNSDCTVGNCPLGSTVTNRDYCIIQCAPNSDATSREKCYAECVEVTANCD